MEKSIVIINSGSKFMKPKKEEKNKMNERMQNLIKAVNSLFSEEDEGMEMDSE